MTHDIENNIEIYAKGPLSLSVCSPFDPEETTRRVNVQHRCGTELGWMLSADPTFATGEPNPCPCEREPDTHMHYFYDC